MGIELAEIDFKPRVLPQMPISIAPAPEVPGKPRPYDDGEIENGVLVYRYRGEDPPHRDNVGLRQATRAGVPLVYFYGVAKGWYRPTWPCFVVEDPPSRCRSTCWPTSRRSRSTPSSGPRAARRGHPPPLRDHPGAPAAAPGFLDVTTAGTYVFLTDDSGIGGPHLDATVGDYEVEYLNELMIRLINESVG